MADPRQAAPRTPPLAGLHLHIERLVLDGVPAGAERALATALARELQHAFASDPALMPAFAQWASREQAASQRPAAAAAVRLVVPKAASAGAAWSPTAGIRAAAHTLAAAGSTAAAPADREVPR